MPHINVKIWPGRPKAKKQLLAEALAETLVEILDCSESSVSVAIEEIESEDWKEKVYEPDIQAKQDVLYKKPGYEM